MIAGKLRNFFTETESDGQALAEFAVVFPFQLFITFGLIQIMLLMASSLVVNFATYRCARAALVNYNSSQKVTVGSTSYSLEEYIKPVAQITLSPLAFHGIAGESSENIYIPGWGYLRGSGVAAAKISLTFDSDEIGTQELIITRLTFKQELLIPVVDRVMQMVLPQSKVDTTQGRNFAGASESNGGIEVLKSKKGHDLVHYLITRQHIMKREADIDTAPGSDVYNYKD